MTLALDPEVGDDVMVQHETDMKGYNGLMKQIGTLARDFDGRQCTVALQLTRFYGRSFAMIARPYVLAVGLRFVGGAGCFG